MLPQLRNSCEVAIIGAGPYGLSIAAHLIHAGLSTRVFGQPMSFWRQHMPKGMKLRSPWGATDLADAGGALSLDTYASRHGVASDRLLPLEDFAAYGEWFASRAVPDIDRRAVRNVERTDHGFALELSDGETIAADRVVIATGLVNQEYRPPVFRNLPSALVTHSSEHADFAPFRGQRIAVIGRGQSACESAALLAEAGADVELISRGDIRWLGIPAGRAPARRLPDFVAAPSAVGPFPLSWLAELPAAVSLMPFRLRQEFNRRCLKAGAAGWLKPRFGNVTCTTGSTISRARAVAGRIVIDLDGRAASPAAFDHVVLGTGYRIDLARLGILSPRLVDTIAGANGSPFLGAGLQASVPKLHFAGAYAVASFGPLLRFIAGAPFAARAITGAAFAGRQGRRSAASPRSIPRLSGAAAPDLSQPR